MTHYSVHHEAIIVFNSNYEITNFISSKENYYDDYIGCIPKHDNFDGSRKNSSKIKTYEALDELYIENEEIAKNHKITLKTENITYIDGILDGKYKKQHSEGYYDMGKRIGFWIFNGEIKCNFVNGILQGKAEFILKDLNCKGYYNNGKKDGIWKIQEKTRIGTVVYQNGAILDKKIVYNSEFLQQTYSWFSYSETEEPFFRKFDNLQLLEEIRTYENGNIERIEKDQTVKKYREDGTLEYETYIGYKLTYYEDGITVCTKEKTIQNNKHLEIQKFDRNGNVLEYFYPSLIYKKTNECLQVIHQVDSDFNQRKWNDLQIKILDVRKIKDNIYSYNEYYDSGKIKSIGKVEILSGGCYTYSCFISKINNFDRIGEFTEYYENGQIKSITNYKHLEKNGMYEEYNENGELKINGLYRSNQKVGKWKNFNKIEIFPFN